MRSIVAVRTSPPNVVGRPGPASSISTITIFGESSCSRGGVTRWAYVDSCKVRPATLADGVGGNGSVVPPGSFGATTPLADSTSMSAAESDMAAPLLEAATGRTPYAISPGQDEHESTPARRSGPPPGPHDAARSRRRRADAVPEPEP